MKRKSCTDVPAHQIEAVPTLRHLPLVDLLVDTRSELLELAVRSGMKVLEAMMEEDRIGLCGVRYAHEPDRAASRAGCVASEVVLGGLRGASRTLRQRTAAAGRPAHRRVDQPTGEERNSNYFVLGVSMSLTASAMVGRRGAAQTGVHTFARCGAEVKSEDTATVGRGADTSGESPGNHAPEPSLT